MRSLYEITGEFAHLMHQAEATAAENEGLMPDDLADMLDALEMEKSEKVEKCAWYYKNQMAEADMIKSEVKGLVERARTAENRAQRIKTYLADLIPGEKFSGSTYSIGWRKSASTIIDNADLIPDEYVQIIRKPIAAEIKRAIKAGVEVAGARVIENNSIQIK